MTFDFDILNLFPDSAALNLNSFFGSLPVKRDRKVWSTETFNLA